MTDAETDAQAVAEQIAARGREALVQRLRAAYAEAAAAHADVVSLDDERIESMVQAAADRADGLQWRRALANVAVDELGISLQEALSHPAVTRAQEIVGAPSYEASLAELIARPVPPPTPAPTATPTATPPSAQEAQEAGLEEPEAPPVIPGQEELFPDSLETVEAADSYVELLPEPLVDDGEPEQVVIEEDDPPAAAQPEPVIEEPEAHGSTGELEAIEADDAVFELMPPPEPIDYEVGSYEALPEEVEAEAPPVLEPVPYEEPEPDPAELHPTETYKVEEAVGYGSEHTDYPPAEAPADELR
ncbi:MAG TPA: hypothetical protein VME01_05960, partial [Solirubrobacteraceae bacterium]|nr:hypothetical protein [Solirubrobacteraceae bacterium]